MYSPSVDDRASLTLNTHCQRVLQLVQLPIGNHWMLPGFPYLQCPQHTQRQDVNLPGQCQTIHLFFSFAQEGDEDGVRKESTISKRILWLSFQTPFWLHFYSLPILMLSPWTNVLRMRNDAAKIQENLMVSMGSQNFYDVDRNIRNSTNNSFTFTPKNLHYCAELIHKKKVLRVTRDGNLHFFLTSLQSIQKIY